MVSDAVLQLGGNPVSPEHVGEPGDLGAADEHRARAVGPGSELGDRALADQPAGPDDHHAVDGLLHLGEQMAGDEHGAALVVGQVPDEPAQPLDALGVQAVGRLVEHEDGGVAEQRRRQGEPLAHAEGVAARPAVAGVGEPDLDEHLVRAAQRQPGGAAVHAQVVATATGRGGRRSRGRRRRCGRARAASRTRRRRTSPCPRRASRGRASSGGSWSCRRRWGRGSR